MNEPIDFDLTPAERERIEHAKSDIERQREERNERDRRHEEARRQREAA